MKQYLLLFVLFVAMGNFLFCDGTTVESAKVINIISKITEGDTSKDIIFRQKVSIEIKSGFLKGRTEIIEVPVYKSIDQNIELKKGDAIVLQIINNEGIYTYKVLKLDTRWALGAVLIFLLIVITFVFDFKGIFVQLGAVAAAITSLFIYFPLICSGWNITVVTVMFLLINISVISILFIRHKFQRKILFFTSIFSIFLTYILWEITLKIFRMDGYITTESYYLGKISENIDLKELVISGNAIAAVASTFIGVMFMLHRLKPVIMKNSRDIQRIFVIAMREGEGFYKIYAIVSFLFMMGISSFEMFSFFIQNNKAHFIEIINSQYIIYVIMRYAINSLVVVAVIPFTAILCGKGAKRLSEDK